MPNRRELWESGVNVRDLSSGEAAGFSISVIEGTGSEARILTAAQQPGHITVAASAQSTRHTHHPNANHVRDRYYGTDEPPEAIGVGRVFEAIWAIDPRNDIAVRALQTLLPYAL